MCASQARILIFSECRYPSYVPPLLCFSPLIMSVAVQVVVETRAGGIKAPAAVWYVDLEPDSDSEAESSVSMGPEPQPLVGVAQPLVGVSQLAQERAMEEAVPLAADAPSAEQMPRQQNGDDRVATEAELPTAAGRRQPVDLRPAWKEDSAESWWTRPRRRPVVLRPAWKEEDFDMSTTASTATAKRCGAWTTTRSTTVTEPSWGPAWKKCRWW